MYINVFELLEENVRDNSDKIALRDEKESLTYGKLYDRVCIIGEYIASVLINETEQNNSYICRNATHIPKPIAVCIDRDIRSIVLFLAVVYSGNFYVPIDTSMPKERIELILNDLSPVMILGAYGRGIDGYDVVDYDRIIDSSQEFYSDLSQKEISRVNPSDIRRYHIDTNPLYAIYTSGSTGKPKGVLISHRSVIDLVEQFDVIFDFPYNPIFGNQAPFDFDVSVKDIYNSLYQHGTLVVIPKMLFSMPLKLIEYINDNDINILIWAVSALRIVENFKTFDRITTDNPRLIMFSGEVMPVRVLNYWKEYIPKATYVNLYGPTEITCNCTYHIIDREYSPDEVLPIGVPFRNTQILLTDRETGRIICEKNKEGEMCVRGSSLALGYYNREDITEAAFTQSPLSDKYPERIYRTGDLGYYGEDGLLYYTARKDHQIKHMGHRIELGEIEASVNAIDYIDAGVCIYDTDKDKIVLFYQVNALKVYDDNKELERDIVKKIGLKLPKYMWPNIYIRYDNLPLNKNGKIDRVTLAADLSNRI